MLKSDLQCFFFRIRTALLQGMLAHTRNFLCFLAASSTHIQHNDKTKYNKEKEDYNIKYA